MAIAWQGPGDISLGKRKKECERLIDFMNVLRENNRAIPVLVGGDFNMDMKNFNIEKFNDYGIVSYRTQGGSSKFKDLRETFMYTMDCLQVLECSTKVHHPDIFATPFVEGKIRGFTREVEDEGAEDEGSRKKSSGRSRRRGSKASKSPPRYGEEMRFKAVRDEYDGGRDDDDKGKY